MRPYILLFTFAACASAQQSVTSGALSGHVEDSSGAALPAAIRIEETATGAVRQAVADGRGRFRFDALPAGHYVLAAAHPQFATAERRITLSVGQALEVRLKLEVAGSSATIEVNDAAPAIEAARTEVAGSVTRHEIESLPLNGRNYLDLALLVPGVSRTNTGSNQQFAETSAVPGTGISIAGQRNLNNGFLLDGLSANDDAAGLAGSFYSEEVIREFQVVTAGGIAEFGRASAGVVDVITKSGSNAWHGRIYSFARNQRFDARNALAARKDPLTQSQYGATLGGPLRRDRTFLFSNFEQMRQNAEAQVTISPANAAALHIPTGGVPTRLDTTNYFARVDRRFGAANAAWARYSLYDVGSANTRNVGGLNAASRGTALADRDQTLAAGDQATLSARTIHEVRAQFTRSRLSAPVNDPAGPAVNISGVANFGTSPSSPTARDLDVYQVNDSISTVRGYHSIKAGADFLEDRTSISFPGARQGVYTFPSLARYLAGEYSTFQQAFGRTDQFVANVNAGGFVQDEWRPRPGLTWNLGLRYDFSALPAPVEPQTHILAPRLGVAISPGDHRFVVRAGFGLYYGRIPLRAVANALQRDGSSFKTAVLALGQLEAPVFPSVLDTFPSNVLVAISTMDHRATADYSVNASLQAEREIARDTAVSLGYEHLRGIHIILQRNLNAPGPRGRPDPRWGNISQYESAGDSYYDGLTLGFTRRASRWGSFRASYTFSKAIDNAGNAFFSAPQDNNNLRDERGLSDNDQRHRVSASGSVALRGWQVSSILTYASSLPFNIQTGNDRNGDTTVNDRPAGVGRNTGRGFDFLTVDGRVSRRFGLRDGMALEVLLEGFNLMNRANWQFPNNVFGTGGAPVAAFGRPTGAAAARQLQAGMRLSW